MRARLIARNTIFNLLGQGIPLLVGLIAMPVAAKGLGPDRFGLLSLAWVIAGYFMVFDLGLGRATTKYVAEMLATGKDNQVPIVVWSSLCTQLIFGLVGAWAFILLTPALVTHMLKIPASLQAEARLMFYVLAFGLPVSLAATSLSGALEARQRFDLTNAIRVPSTVILYIAPVIGVFFNLSLPIVVGFMVGARILAVVALLFINNKVYAEFNRPRGSMLILRQLLGFGGWVTVSAVIGPILVYAERFLISVLISVAALGYYSAPLDALTRLWLIPSSLSTTLFPAFTEMAAVKDYQKALQLAIHSIRVLTAVLLPPLVVITISARELLTIWLGPEFAQQSTAALRIATAGLFINSLATIPYALIQGAGRADLTGKFHLAELPVYLLLCTVLIKGLGITGAAGAWTIRLILDALLLFGATVLLTGRRPTFSLGRTVRTGGGLGATVLALVSIKIACERGSILIHLGLALFALCALYVLAWVLILDQSERRLIRETLSSVW